MGEVTENIHTFALPNESQPYTFKMKYRYDSWKICASRMNRKLVFYSEAQPNLRVANRVQSEIKENILVVLNQYAAGAQASPHSEDECYWYHPDHLGSASWVTDTNGAAYQHLQYMPWGEPLLDQRKSGYTYNTRYTFSGKERDEETGYSYFGARHYHSTLSIWLSVDPMSDKYPGVSPYVYCGNNPVRLVDADGREIAGGDPPKWQIRYYSKIFNKKITSQLINMIDNGANASEVIAKADELSEHYQNKRWFRMNDPRAYRSKPSDWRHRSYYHVKVYSEAQRLVTIEHSRADNNQMEICNDIQIGKDDYAVTVIFIPYVIENELTISSNGQTLLTTGMITGNPTDPYQRELSVSGNSTMTYCIRNSAAAEDTWDMSVTIHSRELKIRVESEIDAYGCGKRNRHQHKLQ